MVANSDRQNHQLNHKSTELVSSHAKPVALTTRGACGRGEGAYAGQDSTAL